MPLCAQIILAFLTVAAVIMATQPFIHYWFGRPKIHIGFSDYSVIGGSVLIGEIHNEPITRGILKFLRISRDVAQDVVAFFTVSGNGMSFSTPGAVLIKTQPNVRAERVSLPASLFPATFVIAVVDYSNKQVKLEDKMEPLVNGEYTVEVVVENEGTQYRSKMGLVVGQPQNPLAYWKELN